MTDGRWGAATLLALVMVLGGCTSDGGGADPAGGRETSSSESSTTESSTGEPDPSAGPAADDAAAAYLKDLARYQRQVARAAGLLAASYREDSAAQYRAAERAFRAALRSAPVLEVVDGGAGSSESYARAVEVDEHVLGFVQEHEWMTGWDRDENVRVYYVLYETESDQFAEQMRLGDAYERALAGPGSIEAKVKRALRAQIVGQLRSAATARRRVERMAGDDSFTPSLRDQVLYEIDDVVAVGERYLEYVETSPAYAIQRDLFRNGFMGGAAVPGGAVADAPLKRAVAARRLLAEGLSGLIRAARGSGRGELPVAGDVYRELILRLFNPTGTDPSGYRVLDRNEQLYWLWRIREIEDTPDEAFENARETIKLQITGPAGVTRVNNDSRFDELAGMYVVMAKTLQDPDSMAVNKPYLVEMLSRPFPEVLTPAVELAREAVDLMPEDGSPAPRRLRGIHADLVEALEQAADVMDDPKQFRREFGAAIEGTRPTA